MGTNPPIRFEEVGQTIYYSESVRLRELREAMSELIESFISETVINSASVPVMLLDSTATRIVKSQGIDVSSLSDPEVLQERLMAMAGDNAPIPVYLPGEGWNLVFYEESLVLTQLKFFPSGAVVADRGVFVGGVFGVQRIQEGRTKPRVGRQAKETAHQLGTPLSSLMAWSSLLSARGVDPEALSEMDKDIARLQVVAERFSKIGSEADLTTADPLQVVEETVNYMRPRISKNVKLSLESGEPKANSAESPPVQLGAGKFVAQRGGRLGGGGVTLGPRSVGG